MGAQMQKLIVDSLRRCAYYQENPLPLTRLESALLSRFGSDEGKIISRNDLLQVMYLYPEAKYSYYLTEGQLNVAIYRIRTKLEGMGCIDCIKTIHGRGYKGRNIEILHCFEKIPRGRGLPVHKTLTLAQSLTNRELEILHLFLCHWAIGKN